MSARRQTLKPLDFHGLRTTSLKDRPSKVCLDDFGKPWEPGSSLARFLDRLPGVLAAEQLREAVGAIASAFRGKRTILMGMGAHPIKVGLNPILIDAMERGILSGLALNGAGVVHDVELALAGKTSEDVAAHLNQGQFGTARETAEFIHDAVAAGFRTGNQGMGRAVGREAVCRTGAPYAHMSLLATAASLELPVTVHVAVGTDIVHMHPAMDGAATGALSHYDFRLFCRLVSTLAAGRLPQSRFGRDHPGSLPEGGERCPQPGIFPGRDHHHQHGLSAPLPDSGQCGRAPHPRNRFRDQFDRPSRNHVPAPHGGGFGTVGREDLDGQAHSHSCR